MEESLLKYKKNSQKVLTDPAIHLKALSNDNFIQKRIQQAKLQDTYSQKYDHYVKQKSRKTIKQLISENEMEVPMTEEEYDEQIQDKLENIGLLDIQISDLVKNINVITKDLEGLGSKTKSERAKQIQLQLQKEYHIRLDNYNNQLAELE